VNRAVEGAALWGAVAREVAELEAAGLRRRLRVAQGPADAELVLDGIRLVNFGSNNYLGLANHPEVVAAAADAVRAWGTGAGASRLISGNQAPVPLLEHDLAALMRSEAALVFSSGYLANLGTIPVLVGEEDAIACDRLNHASLIDAARLAKAKLLIYPHADMIRLNELLSGRRNEFRRILIVSDGLFSMDGDIAPLPELLALAERHDAQVYLDDAHATAVLGSSGGGTLDHFGLEPGERLIRMGSLSKALGGAGGFVAGPAILRDMLVNRARAFIFDTGIPASVAAGARSALAVAGREPGRRERVRELSRRVRAGLTALGLSVPAGATPVIPVVLGDNATTMRWMEALVTRGCFVPGVRPPTVPAGEGRLRISLMATHTDEHVDHLLQAMKAIQEEEG